MIEELTLETEEKMMHVIEFYQRELATMRAGRANPAILDKITVDYYGTPTPLKQVGNISVPEPQLLVVQPWDKSIIKEIEKAILKSDLGLNPNNDGNVIRLPIPALTEERRKDLVKQINKKAEEQKVAIRNLRRDANDLIKKAEKDSNITEDDRKEMQDEIQKLTDKYIKEIDEKTKVKSDELMSI